VNQAVFLRSSNPDPLRRDLQQRGWPPALPVCWRDLRMVSTTFSKPVSCAQNMVRPCSREPIAVDIHDIHVARANRNSLLDDLRALVHERMQQLLNISSSGISRRLIPRSRDTPSMSVMICGSGMRVRPSYL